MTFKFMSEDYEVLNIVDMIWTRADKTAFSCKLDLGLDQLVPFGCVYEDNEPNSDEVWDLMESGKFGKPADYVPPTIEELRSRFPNLSARQLRLGLRSLGKLAEVPAAIAQLPEPAKSEAEIEWEFASEFRRLHPLIIQLIGVLGMDEFQVDAVWQEYAQK